MGKGRALSPSHRGGGLSPFCFHADLRATIPPKSPSCTSVFSRFLLAAASLRHPLPGPVGQVVVHHFLISRPAICHSDALAEISLHVPLLLFYATSLPQVQRVPAQAWHGIVQVQTFAIHYQSTQKHLQAGQTVPAARQSRRILQKVMSLHNKATLPSPCQSRLCRRTQFNSQLTMRRSLAPPQG